MNIVFVIIGALIGAGFASGQEIYVFFYRYQVYGIMGLIFCSILSGIVIYKAFLIMIENKEIKDYSHFLNIILNGNSKVTKITNIIINIALLETFYIMISGFGAYMEQEFEINKMISAFILAFICFIVFMTNIKGVTKINTIIVPLLIICIIIIGIYNMLNVEFENIGNNVTQKELNGWVWIWQSIIYCSYNMILLIPVIINFKDYIKNKRKIIVISVCCGITIFVLAISLYMLLVNVDVDFSFLEMPAVYAISKCLPTFRGVYGIVILLSIFTTAISTGISFLENILKNKRYFPQIAGIMCITSVIISNFGFSNLVNFSFPILGYLGLIQIIYILLK